MSHAPKQDVRAKIANGTRAIHEKLHSDPVLKKLTANDVTTQQYLNALAVLSGFYHAVEHERRRFAAWEPFTLASECKALDFDLRGTRRLQVALRFNSVCALLGGLYVAHGASFGRNLFRRNLNLALPDMPLIFVKQTTDTATWRMLIEQMEQKGAQPAQLKDLMDGAVLGFQAVEKASQTCRALS